MCGGWSIEVFTCQKFVSEGGAAAVVVEVRARILAVKSKFRDFRLKIVSGMMLAIEFEFSVQNVSRLDFPIWNFMFYLKRL